MPVEQKFGGRRRPGCLRHTPLPVLGLEPVMEVGPRMPLRTPSKRSLVIISRQRQRSHQVGDWPRDVEHTGHPTATGANWLGCHANIPRTRLPCNSRLCHDLGHRETLGSEPSRMSLTSVTFGLVASTATKKNLQDTRWTVKNTQR